MHQMIFVNLPVADVERSREFFEAVGYEFDERMCQADTSLGVILGPNIYAMLLSHEHFHTFLDSDIAESTQTEVLTCLSAESREQVDGVVDRAIAAGGTQVRRQEYGEWMYGRSYADLDGHVWEMMWMDVEKAIAAGEFG